ncbi:hypothetical protein HK100_003721 [Physocladia obscura]|uniref:Uncharacterized protein n=1 Tax=Physocladia obscura TaxID=109957 RepID=A0AAD5XL44_9FUNG|nr:hypothetical protein HK100_003721 [Physocladia obscura]
MAAINKPALTATTDTVLEHLHALGYLDTSLNSLVSESFLRECADELNLELENSGQESLQQEFERQDTSREQYSESLVHDYDSLWIDEHLNNSTSAAPAIDTNLTKQTDENRLERGEEFSTYAHETKSSTTNELEELERLFLDTHISEKSTTLSSVNNNDEFKMPPLRSHKPSAISAAAFIYPDGLLDFEDLSALEHEDSISAFINTISNREQRRAPSVPPPREYNSTSLQFNNNNLDISHHFSHAPSSEVNSQYEAKITEVSTASFDKSLENTVRMFKGDQESFKVDGKEPSEFKHSFKPQPFSRPLQSMPPPPPVQQSLLSQKTETPLGVIQRLASLDLSAMQQRVILQQQQQKEREHKDQQELNKLLAKKNYRSSDESIASSTSPAEILSALQRNQTVKAGENSGKNLPKYTAASKPFPHYGKAGLSVHANIEYDSASESSDYWASSSSAYNKPVVLSNIPGFIRTSQQAKKIAHKSDPVARFHAHQKQWKKDEFLVRHDMRPKPTLDKNHFASGGAFSGAAGGLVGGISSSGGVGQGPRVRHNLAAMRPTYVAPQEKSRRDVVWEVRTKLARML